MRWVLELKLWRFVDCYNFDKEHFNSIPLIFFLVFKGLLHLWALFLKILCIFSKDKATLDKVSYGSVQKCSKELKNLSFTSVEAIVVKLEWKMCKNVF